MSQGLQVWDTDGFMVLDTSSQTVKILGVFKVSSDPVTFSDPLLATETPFYIVSPEYRHTGDTTNLNVEFNGSTCTVTNSSTYNNRTIYVGVY